MDEHLLQYIWKHRYFDQSHLMTHSGESLSILHTGFLNRHQGPDFQQALIQVNETKWSGNIELHLRSSDWLHHGHQNDERYKNVILHVVWENDRETGLNIPVLELHPRVPKILLQKYRLWMEGEHFIPCAGEIKNVQDFILERWKERMVMERLFRKSMQIRQQITELKNHWEELLWQRLARGFGGMVNGEVFEAIAVSLPQTLLARHKRQLFQLEALLLGQAGLLPESIKGKDSYIDKLEEEFQFLKHKYGLKPIPFPLKFLRMRPASFPSIRLVQLARLIHQSSHLFSFVRETENLEEIMKLFKIKANGYWENHNHMGEVTRSAPKSTGQDFISFLMINTIIPVLFTFGNSNGNRQNLEKALRWLHELEAEKNQTVSTFKKNGIMATTAADTQALLELKQQYCDQKRCLQCAIGRALLRAR